MTELLKSALLRRAAVVLQEAKEVRVLTLAASLRRRWLKRDSGAASKEKERECRGGVNLER